MATSTRTYLADWRSPQDGEYNTAIEYELLAEGHLHSVSAYPAERGRRRVVVTAEEAVHAFILTIPGVTEVI